MTALDSPPLADGAPLGIWTYQLEAQPMARAQEAAAALEELGFGSLWVPEAVAREPFANTALLLSATERITVATGIAGLHSRTAMTMNAGLQTLTEAFPGRFLLGVGVSHQPMVEGNHGGAYGARPYSTMADYLDGMDSGVYLGAAPTVPPSRMLAALGPRMLRLAAARTKGAHTYFVPVEHTASAREIMGPDALLVPAQTVILESDPAAARALARTFMQRYLGLPNYSNNLLRLGWSEADFAHGGSDALVDAIVAWGSLERVTERIQAHLDAGADHVCVQVLTATPAAIPLPQWRELASIIPALRTRAAATTS